MRWLSKLPVLLTLILAGCAFMYVFVARLASADVSEPSDYFLPLLSSLLVSLLLLGGAIALIVKDFRFKERVQNPTVSNCQTTNESLLSGIANEFNSRIVSLIFGIIICIFLIQWWAGFVLLIAYIVFIIGAIFWYGRKAKEKQK